MDKRRKKKLKRAVVLRIDELMAKAGLRYATDLHKLLLAEGVDISHSHLTRVINNTANSLTVDLLSGLASIFDCPVRELFSET